MVMSQVTSSESHPRENFKRRRLSDSRQGIMSEESNSEEDELEIEMPQATLPTSTDVHQIANKIQSTPDAVDSKLFCLSQLLSTSGFSDFLESNKGTFLLHYIQRPYEWDEEMAVEFVKSLLNDWVKSLNHQGRITPKHIGQIILWTEGKNGRNRLNEGENVLWVMDGQQRFVTIFILFSLLHHSLLVADPKAADKLWNEAKDIFGLVQNKYNQETKQVETKWTPRIRVGEFQRKFWEDHLVSPVKFHTPISGTDEYKKYLEDVQLLLQCEEYQASWESIVNGDPIISRMIKNFRAIHKYLSTVPAGLDRNAELPSSPASIYNLLVYLLKHVFLTTTTHVGGGHEFSCRTFLSANSMQAPLTNVDMLKAAIFSNLESTNVADCSKIWEHAYLGLEKHVIRACSNTTAFEYMFEVIREIKDMPSGRRSKLAGILHYFYGEYGHDSSSRQKFRLPNSSIAGVERDPKAFLQKYVEVVSRNMIFLFNWRKIGEKFQNDIKNINLTIDRLKTSCRHLLRCAAIKPNRGAYGNRRPSLFSWIPVAVVFFELYFPKSSQKSKESKKNLKTLAGLMKLLEIRLAWVVIAAERQGSDVITVMSSGGQWRQEKTDGILKIICHPTKSKKLMDQVDDETKKCLEMHEHGTVPKVICKEQYDLVEEILRLTHDEQMGMIKTLLKVRYDKNDSTKMRHILFIHDDEMRCPSSMTEDKFEREVHSILRYDYNIERTRKQLSGMLELDHLFPQASRTVIQSEPYWVEHWLEDGITREVHDILKHLPGNICLFPGPKNRKAGKKGYDRKREVFLEDLTEYVDVKSTRELVNSYIDWTPADCRKRDLEVLINVVKYLKIEPNNSRAKVKLETCSKELVEENSFWFKKNNESFHYQLLHRWDTAVSPCAPENNVNRR